MRIKNYSKSFTSLMATLYISVFQQRFRQFFTWFPENASTNNTIVLFWTVRFCQIIRNFWKVTWLEEPFDLLVFNSKKSFEQILFQAQPWSPWRPWKSLRPTRRISCTSWPSWRCWSLIRMWSSCSVVVQIKVWTYHLILTQPNDPLHLKSL